MALKFYRQFAYLVHELAKFGVIGILNFVITIGISNTLHLGVGMGPLTSFGIGTVVATTFSYFANRFWTFRHRDTTGLGREYVLFFVFNGVGLVITWAFIGFTYYVLGMQNGVAFNASQVVGTAIATLFRFWAYKKWVFLPPTVPPVDPHTGLPEAQDEPAGAAAPEPKETAGHVPAAGPVAAGPVRRAR
ncbi:MAG: GtrA family protein [Actinoallomurus sp.]|jgi:putative flippase GtrA|nr:GtrA family protein [Actinoallomurus sp.]